MTIQTLPSIQDRDLAASVLRTLQYFDVFQHPLLATEIQEFSDIPGIELSKVEHSLHRLMEIGIVGQCSGYFYLGSDIGKVKRRIEGNLRACKRMPTARFFSRLISLFPYTRAVLISGSFSKGVMHPDSDIDFFIITKPGRLWLNRTLLALFKKVFLLNSHKNFCINYFIDEEHLTIPDKNRFTATEIATLMPMSNYHLHQKFLIANGWHKDYYPNHGHLNRKPDRAPLIRRVLEIPLNTKLGDWLEQTCMRISNSFWKRKYHMQDIGNPHSDIYSTPWVSKYHPNRQQFVVLESYSKNLKKLFDTPELSTLIVHQQ